MSYPDSGDRRQLERWPCDSVARLTILREYGPGADMTVLVSECSGSGMRLEAPQELAPGDPVRIDLGDSLLLGEVVHAAEQAATDAKRNWMVGIRFEQGIFGLNALQRLLAAVAGDRERESEPKLERGTGPNSSRA